MTQSQGGLSATVFTVTIFISASLLFFVQPMFAKMVLPHLGGAPAVWTTAMLFFQTVLLAGYAYAHFVATRLPGRVQIGVHAAVWAAGLLFLPIAIPADWAFDPEGYPALETLVLFAAGVGLPFFALAANAPLLQKWYARSGGPSADDPYHLYASSNAGSLVSLLAFPLVAEPLMGTAAISRSWGWIYVVLGVGLALCAMLVLRGNSREAPEPSAAPAYRPSVGQIAKWVAIAFVPSSMMLGVTSIISTDLGAFPLVWVIPLALYLLTFVLAFSKRLRLPEKLVALLFVTTTVLIVVAMAMNVMTGLGLVAIGGLFAAFFLTALMFHTRLYESRPPEAGLTPFYFAMAFGGALGGLFNSVIAPAIFNSNYEAPIIFALAGLALAGPWRPLRDVGVAFAIVAGLSAIVLAGRAIGITPRDSVEVFILTGLMAFMALLIARQKPLQFAVTAALLLAIGHQQFQSIGVTHRDRSFFGIYTVKDRVGDGIRVLSHGTTEHGHQYIDDTGTKPRPLSYYHPRAPLGQVFGSEVIAPDAKVGVVGLGVGALSCYATPGQTWRFYEIDKLVDDIARDPAHFSYMDQCAREMPTILGDARLTLAQETDAPFDVLVIDAYSSDAIPIHLITLEALDLYRERMTADGILVMHISNRFYELAPILGNAAEVLGITALYQNRAGTVEDPIQKGEVPSKVVLMSADPAALAPFVGDPRWKALAGQGGLVWTDDHANLLSAL